MKNFRKISFYENIIVFSLNKKVLFQKLLKEAIVSFSFSFFYWEFQKFIVSYAKKHKLPISEVYLEPCQASKMGSF